VRGKWSFFGYHNEGMGAQNSRGYAAAGLLDSFYVHASESAGGASFLENNKVRADESRNPQCFFCAAEKSRRPVQSPAVDHLRGADKDR
jgi:hypothetical protein